MLKRNSVSSKTNVEEEKHNITNFFQDNNTSDNKACVIGLFAKCKHCNCISMWSIKCFYCNKYKI